MNEYDDINAYDLPHDLREIGHSVKSDQPCVVVIDIEHSHYEYIRLAEAINRIYPYIKVIALIDEEQKNTIAGLLDCTLAGYLFKSSSIKTLIFAIRQLVSGNEHYVDTGKQTAIIRKQSTTAWNKYHLTNREIEILGLIKNEHTSASISKKLHISVFTVDTHRKHIIHKLGAKTAASMVKFAIENNL